MYSRNIRQQLNLRSQIHIKTKRKGMAKNGRRDPISEATKYGNIAEDRVKGGMAKRYWISSHSARLHVAKLSSPQ